MKKEEKEANEKAERDYKAYNEYQMWMWATRHVRMQAHLEYLKSPFAVFKLPTKKKRLKSRKR